MSLIVVLTGTNGAGKDIIVQHLCSHYNFKHYSFSGFITEEIKCRNMPVNRDTMTEVGNDIRSENGGACIAIELLKQAEQIGGNAVIESFRTPEEADFFLMQPKVTLLVADAPIELRYERVQKRGSEKDSVTFEKFVQQERVEMENADRTKQNLRYCIDKTPMQYRLINDTTIEDFKKKIDLAMESIQQK